MICITVDSVRPTQSNVIQIIYRNVGLKCCFYEFYQNIYLLLSLDMHISFIFYKVV